MEVTPAAPRRSDVYREVTEKIVLCIKRGAPRFEMPWHRSGPSLRRPVNAYTGSAYQGVNVLALWVATEFGHFTSRYFATYKQWKRLECQVRGNERGAAIVFFKEATREAYDEKAGEVVAESYLVARSSFVFNADQVDGWQAPVSPMPSEAESIAEAEAFVSATKADIRHGGERAFYSPSHDTIQVPDRERFTGTGTSSATQGYYATLFHELSHWTGHETRLNRDLRNRFGDHAYAMEELVAELGAAFLCADLRIANAPRLDHAAYIASWLEVLQSDKKALFTAASKAAAAADYLDRLQLPTDVPAPDAYAGPLPLQASVGDALLRREDEHHGS
jgi:antirestriction protein ArdC